MEVLVEYTLAEGLLRTDTRDTQLVHWVAQLPECPEHNLFIWDSSGWMRHCFPACYKPFINFIYLNNQRSVSKSINWVHSKCHFQMQVMGNLMVPVCHCQSPHNHNIHHLDPETTGYGQQVSKLNHIMKELEIRKVDSVPAITKALFSPEFNLKKNLDSGLWHKQRQKLCDIHILYTRMPDKES